MERNRLQLHQPLECASDDERNGQTGDDGQFLRTVSGPVPIENIQQLSHLGKSGGGLRVGDVEKRTGAMHVAGVPQPRAHRLYPFCLRDHSVSADEKQVEVRIDAEPHRHGA